MLNINLLSRTTIRPLLHRQRVSLPIRGLSNLSPSEEKEKNSIEKQKVEQQFWEKRFGQSSTNFPDYIEQWGRKPFVVTGIAMTAGSGAALALLGPASAAAWGFAAGTLGYWWVGINDITQRKHTIRRNFPVLGNIRYIFETIRPEIRQYFIESDSEAVPFSRQQRSIVYQRAKNSSGTLPFGTRRQVYKEGYEWIVHSMWPKHVVKENERIMIGGKHCKQPYEAALLNVSGMSYGALSDNAILALNKAAKLGGFYHNTGEGGISEFHLRPGGDIVWNVGTGYFGCRTSDGKFDPEKFKKTASAEAVKMIEIKLSQGAKPSHGGMLPGSKVTKFIAEARGVNVGEECLSPPSHSAFSTPLELMDFIKQLRELSGGKPIGFKLCVGRPEEFASLVHAMIEKDCAPDFITVDGSEGGTGAAPPEFTNSVGMPLIEGLTFVNDLLIGAGIRDQIKIIAAGKVISGFSIVRNLALGADVCNSARAMMFALGCIQSLKCDSNKCPSGVATQNSVLMAGLDPFEKSVRVFNYQRNTVDAAMHIIGAAGFDSPSGISRNHVMVRTDGVYCASYAELYPKVEVGSLVKRTSTRENLQQIWDAGRAVMAGSPVQQDVHP
eukprot:CFRG7849T1